MSKAQGLILFVSRLSSYSTTEQLHSLFSRFGSIREARLIKDPHTQKPKGYGFVTFESENDAIKALKTMNGRIVNGRMMFVEVAKTTRREEEQSS